MPWPPSRCALPAAVGRRRAGPAALPSLGAPHRPAQCVCASNRGARGQAPAASRRAERLLYVARDDTAFGTAGGKRWAGRRTVKCWQRAVVEVSPDDLGKQEEFTEKFGMDG